jgi:hypothetical protein
MSDNQWQATCVEDAHELDRLQTTIWRDVIESGIVEHRELAERLFKLQWAEFERVEHR